jgi:hypothetical protein
MPTTAGKPPGNHEPNFRSVAGWNMMFHDVPIDQIAATGTRGSQD